MADIMGEWGTKLKQHRQEFLEINQFAHEIIRIIKLINFLHPRGGTVAEKNVINHSHIFNYLTNLSPQATKKANKP